MTFSWATTIRFTLHEERNVILEILDLNGRKVIILLDEVRSRGDHYVYWNARDLPSGVYLCRLRAGNRVAAKKMILVK